MLRERVDLMGDYMVDFSIWWDPVLAASLPRARLANERVTALHDELVALAIELQLGDDFPRVDDILELMDAMRQFYAHRQAVLAEKNWFAFAEANTQ